MEKFSQKKEEISHGKEKFTPKMGKIIPNIPTKMENRSQIFPKNRQLLNRHFHAIFQGINHTLSRKLF
jgi:hypothetical protein